MVKQCYQICQFLVGQKLENATFESFSTNMFVPKENLHDSELLNVLTLAKNNQNTKELLVQSLSKLVFSIL